MRRGVPADEYSADAARGRLLARPPSPGQTPTSTPPEAPGLHALALPGEVGRAALLYLPTGYDATRPLPLVVMLHGAGGGPQSTLALLQSLADEAGLILLVPASHLPSWDLVMGGFGPDVASLDRALDYVFAHCAVDPARVVIAGFSDGASYALALGVINGELFSRVIAFSPGFLRAREWHGQPRIYVSHGTRDDILPVEACGQRVVEQLRGAGYDVTYHEFDGPHTVPAEIAREAVAWLDDAED